MGFTMTVEYPLITEKSIGLIEKENKIVFIVEKRAGKKQIKEAVEKLYDVKVESVNTVSTMKGRKKAFVKLKKPYKAADLATKLKIM